MAIEFVSYNKIAVGVYKNNICIAFIKITKLSGVVIDYDEYIELNISQQEQILTKMKELQEEKS